MHCFQDICAELGIQLAHDKTVGPVTKLTFLGIEIDTITRSVKIPEPKIVELKAALEAMLQRPKTKLKALQSLVGKLNFFSKAIRGGRAFNRRFYDAMMGAEKPNHYIRITRPMKEDLSLWLQFLQSFNGVSYFPEREWSSSEVLSLFTDSAGASELGCGCYFKNEWIFMQWPGYWGKCDIIRDITFLELVPIVLNTPSLDPNQRNCTQKMVFISRIWVIIICS